MQYIKMCNNLLLLSASVYILFLAPSLSVANASSVVLLQQVLPVLV